MKVSGLFQGSSEMYEFRKSSGSLRRIPGILGVSQEEFQSDFTGILKDFNFKNLIILDLQEFL